MILFVSFYIKRIAIVANDKGDDDSSLGVEAKLDARFHVPLMIPTSSLDGPVGKMMPTTKSG